MTAPCRRPILADEREAWQTFGGLLATLRQRAGISQRQLALASGISKQHMQRIEWGQRRTRLSRLVQIVDFLAPFMPDADPGDDDTYDAYADRVINALLDVSGVTLAPESAYADDPKTERREQARGLRRWQSAVIGGPEQRKVRQTRQRGEEERRRARRTLHAARSQTSLEDWQGWLRGM